jgi:AmiR/NasT family two-component response regulator
MEKRGISEVAAHRYLQRRSMDSGLTMAETAKHVIDSLGRPRKF